MGVRAATQSKLFLDAWDLSGDMNALALDVDGDPQDASVFGFDTKRFIPGLKAARFSHAGIWQTGTDKLDEVLASKFAIQNTLMTIAPETGAEGEIAYFLRMLEAQYAPFAGAGIGQVVKFTVTGSASDSLVRGTILHNAARTGSGNGTAFNVGAVASGQKLFAGLHVVAISGGPTVTIKIQSDDNGGMSSPTDRITFSAVTVKGSQWATPVVGPITDDQWRATWSFAGGASPSITFLVVMGIL